MDSAEVLRAEDLVPEVVYVELVAEAPEVQLALKLVVILQKVAEDELTSNPKFLLPLMLEQTHYL